MKIQSLSEARRNPKLNVKLTVKQQLKEILGRADKFPDGNINAFVSFTDINKLGLNPKSPYDVVAIYGYPLDYILDKMKYVDNPLKANIPFAGNRPFIQVFKLKPECNLVYADDQSKDVQRFHQILELAPNDFSHVIPRLDTVSKCVKAMIHGAFNDGKQSNQAFRTLGIDAVVDYGGGIIHGNEKTQIMVFSMQHVGLIETVLNPSSDNKSKIDGTSAIGKSHLEKRLDSKKIEGTAVGHLIFTSSGITNSAIQQITSKLMDQLPSERSGAIVSMLQGLCENLYFPIDEEPEQFKNLLSKIQRTVAKLHHIYTDVKKEGGLDDDYIMEHFDALNKSISEAYDILVFLNSPVFTKLVSELRAGKIKLDFYNSVIINRFEWAGGIQYRRASHRMLLRELQGILADFALEHIRMTFDTYREQK